MTISMLNEVKSKFCSVCSHG